MPIENRVRTDRGNRLLAAIPLPVWAALKPHLELVELGTDDVLCAQGEPGQYAHFPLRGTLVSLSLDLAHPGRVEAATIGAEGVINGIITSPDHPSYATASVQIGGQSARIPSCDLEHAKERSAALRDVLSRYADVLLAQLLQATVCNVLHPMEQRLARWLLTTHDRMELDELPLTQDDLAQMLCVHRSTVIRVVKPLQNDGIIAYARGRILIKNRRLLERSACECYAAVSRHYTRILANAESLNRPKTKQKRSR